jgi:hypothetical protein
LVIRQFLHSINPIFNSASKILLPFQLHRVEHQERGTTQICSCKSIVIQFGATVDDLANLDLGYTPPFSEAMDNLHHAANILCNKIDGVAQGLSPFEVKTKLAAGEEFVLLDVRSAVEVEALRIDAPNITYVPLGMLRSKLDNLPKDKPIVTFCKVSLRGYEALRILQGGRVRRRQIHERWGRGLAV